MWIRSAKYYIFHHAPWIFHIEYTGDLVLLLSFGFMNPNLWKSGEQRELSLVRQE